MRRVTRDFVEQVISDCPHSTALNLSNHGVSKIENMDLLSEILQTLDLSHNRITIIENIHSFTQLVTLDLSYNNIGDISGIEGCISLATLLLHNNSISTVSSLHPMRNLKRLHHLTLYNNPIHTIPHFATIIRQIIPKLLTLDNAPFDNDAVTTTDVPITPHISALEVTPLQQSHLQSHKPNYNNHTQIRSHNRPNYETQPSIKSGPALSAMLSYHSKDVLTRTPQQMLGLENENRRLKIQIESLQQMLTIHENNLSIDNTDLKSWRDKIVDIFIEHKGFLQRELAIKKSLQLQSQNQSHNIDKISDEMKELEQCRHDLADENKGYQNQLRQLYEEKKKNSTRFRIQTENVKNGKQSLSNHMTTFGTTLNACESKWKTEITTFQQTIETLSQRLNHYKNHSYAKTNQLSSDLSHAAQTIAQLKEALSVTTEERNTAQIQALDLQKRNENLNNAIQTLRDMIDSQNTQLMRRQSDDNIQRTQCLRLATEIRHLKTQQSGIREFCLETIQSCHDNFTKTIEQPLICLSNHSQSTINQSMQHLGVIEKRTDSVSDRMVSVTQSLHKLKQSTAEQSKPQLTLTLSDDNHHTIIDALVSPTYDALESKLDELVTENESIQTSQSEVEMWKHKYEQLLKQQNIDTTSVTDISIQNEKPIQTIDESALTIPQPSEQLSINPHSQSLPNESETIDTTANRSKQATAESHTDAFQYDSSNASFNAGLTFKVREMPRPLIDSPVNGRFEANLNSETSDGNKDNPQYVQQLENLLNLTRDLLVESEEEKKIKQLLPTLQQQNK